MTKLQSYNSIVPSCVQRRSRRNCFHSLWTMIVLPLNMTLKCSTPCSIVELCQSSGSGLSVLRTFRLLRILKLVRFLPALRRQLVIMLRTVDNVAVFFALLILFIFIFRYIFTPLFLHFFTWFLLAIQGMVCIVAEKDVRYSDKPLIGRDFISKTADSPRHVCQSGDFCFIACHFPTSIQIVPLGYGVGGNDFATRLRV